MDRAKDIERMILLSQSGEWTSDQRSRLDTQQTDDVALRAEREKLDRLCRESRKALLVDGPSADVMQRISEEARRRVEHPGVVVRFPSPVVRLAACAAALAVMVGTWVAWPPEKPERDGVADLRTLVALVAAHDVDVDSNKDAAEQERIRSLAHELLILQGLEVEDFTVEDVPEPEPRTTTLRWRSIPASRAEIYG
jgi:hypothetical protein